MKLYDSQISTILENGRLIKLKTIAISKLLENISIYLLGTVNSIMLAGYSQDAVAVANLSNQIINLAVVLLNMVVTGSTICMSLAFGRDDKKLSGEISGTALNLATVASVVVTVVIMIFAIPLLELMNVEPGLLDMAGGYLRIVAGFFPVLVLMNCFNNFLICNGYAAYTLLVGLVYNALNVVFCYVVLYVPISLPVSTVDGVAYAGRFACLAGLVLSMIIYAVKKCPFKFCFSPSAFAKIMRIGVPGGMNMFSYNLAQSITTSFIASLGMETFATKVYISSIIVFSNTISFSIGHGGSMLMGRYRGMENYNFISKLYNQNMRIAILGNIIVSSVVFALHRPLMGLFNADAAAVAIAGKIMLIDIVVQIFRGINNVSDQSLNANGDVKITLAISACACWLFSVLMSYILGVKFGMGLVGVWIAFMMDEGFKSVMYVLRWRSGHWKHVRV